ncbi:MAG TPA: alkylphosphonate utilization protein, partial [Halomonas sp.]|nr:alkylphosphonate utilization protein [Halomonas sp.]
MSCPPCPHCQSEFVYQSQSLFICPECAHEWNPAEAQAEDTVTVKDAHGG